MAYEAMADFLESEIEWLDHIHSRIASVFLAQLTHKRRFCELYNDDEGKRPVGIWGWNTWCGIHDLTPLVDDDVHLIMKNTFDEGLSRPETGTGLLPHAVPIDRDGRVGFRDGKKEAYYRTYSGVHGEDYCLDNIICWAKMALEFFLYTRDSDWFNLDRLAMVERSTDYMLENLRGAYNPDLLESGIEGDWTENTNWHADNSNNNVCMLHCLDLITEVEEAFGRSVEREKYASLAREMRASFQQSPGAGGFWDDAKGWFLHGNDGDGTRVYGERYFESTANYFSILWEGARPEQEMRIWSYLDSNPEVEMPLPVLTNHLPRDSARRMHYGHTVTDGDVWLTLGAHATAARLRAGFTSRATEMYKAIIDYEITHGTIHNSIYSDGSADLKWSPEIGNYGSIFTPLVEGVLGLSPRADGLLIDPRPLEGMRRLEVKIPLTYAGKGFLLKARWKGGSRVRASMDGRAVATSGSRFLLPPDYEDGCMVGLTFE